MRQTLDRAGKFLNLVALLAALLPRWRSRSSRGFRRQRHLDDCAMLRVLGQPQGAPRVPAQPPSAWGCSPACSAWRSASWCTITFRLAARRAGGGPHARGRRVAGAVRPRRGHDAAARLRPAAGAAAGAAAAARDPARRRRAQTGSLAVLAAGTAGFVALLAGGVSRDLKLGAHRGGRLRRWRWSCSRCCPGWRCGCCAAPVPGNARAALADSGHAPDRARPAFAVLQVSALAVGLLALVLLVLLRTDLISAGAAPRRPTRPTASSSTSSPSRAEAFRRAWPRRRGALRLVPDDPRPAGGHQRQAVSPRRLARTARAAWSTASSTSATATLPPHNQVAAGAGRRGGRRA